MPNHKSKEDAKIYRDNKLKLGLCPNCGNWPLVRGKKRCFNCLEKNRRYQKKYHEGKKNG